MKFTGDFKIISNSRLSDEYFILNLLSSNKLPEIKPGQFVQVLVERREHDHVVSSAMVCAALIGECLELECFAIVVPDHVEIQR